MDKKLLLSTNLKQLRDLDNLGYLSEKGKQLIKDCERWDNEDLENEETSHGSGQEDCPSHG